MPLNSISLKHGIFQGKIAKTGDHSCSTYAKFSEKLTFHCVSIFLRAIVLQTCNSNECINSPTCRVESPTSLF